MKKIFLCIGILIFIVILNTTQLKASEKNNEDINNYPNGDYDDLKQFIDSIKK